MRFFAYWLLRGTGAALLGGATLMFLLGLADYVAANSSTATPEEWASLTQTELTDGIRSLIVTGIACGLVSAVAALGGWQISKPFAFRITGVIETAEGDAIVHPAVLYLDALSPGARQKWHSSHPSLGRYRLTIATLLATSGTLVIQPASALSDITAFVPIAYLWGLLSYHIVAAFGGRVQRWTGLPAEVLAHRAFGRDAGARD